MSGICGWIGADRNDAAAVIAAMRGRITWHSSGPECSAVGRGYGLAAVGSPETTGVFEFGGLHVAFHGHARWRNGSLRFAAPADVCRQLASAFRHRGVEALSSLEGDFAVAILDPVRRELTLAIDRIGTRNLVYRQEADTVVFAANLDALAAHPSVSQRIDPQSIYNYVYFHMIPGPETVFAGSRRLPAGHCLNARPGSIVEEPYWQMRFEENQRGDERELAREFRRIVETAVDAASSGAACGTFLSGGTDSSTITGFLSRLAQWSGGQLLDRLRRKRLRRDVLCPNRRAPFRYQAPRVLRDTGRRGRCTATDRRRVRPAVRQRLRGAHLLLRQARPGARHHAHAGRRRRRRAVRRQRTLRQAAGLRPLRPHPCGDCATR